MKALFLLLFSFFSFSSFAQKWAGNYRYETSKSTYDMVIRWNKKLKNYSATVSINTGSTELEQSYSIQDYGNRLDFYLNSSGQLTSDGMLLVDTKVGSLAKPAIRFLLISGVVYTQYLLPKVYPKKIAYVKYG